MMEQYSKVLPRRPFLKKIILLHDIQVIHKGQQAVSQTSSSVYNDQTFKRSTYRVSINSYSKIFQNVGHFLLFCDGLFLICMFPRIPQEVHTEEIFR